jgi:hypothetical protein
MQLPDNLPSDRYLEIPQDVLNKCEKFTLRDLLESTAFRSFMVSGLANGVNVGTLLADDKDYEASELEDLLQYEMHKILFAIPFKVRRAHFKTSGMLVKATKEFHQA